MTRAALGAIAAGALALSAAHVHAQAPPAPTTRLTLAQALAAADANYPKIRASAEQKTSAEAGVDVARAAYLPRADMLWQTNRATANNVYGLLLPQSVIPSISGPVIASDNGRSAWGSASGVLFSWQPFDFGARHAEVDVARQGAAAATAALGLTKLDVAVAAASAFLDLATAEQLAAIAAANEERLQVFAKSVHVLADNQLRPGAEAAQADAGLAAARTQSIQARTAVAVRRAALANLVGMPAAQLEIDAASLLASSPAEAQGPVPAASHPAAQQEAAFVKQQQARVDLLKRTYVPQFNTQAGLSGRGTGTALNGVFPGGSNGLAPGTMNWAAGVQVTFPAFSIFTLRAQQKAQEANLRAEQARYRQTVDDLSTQVQQAEAVLAGAREVAQNTPVQLSAARLSETQQHARFQAGLGTVIDVAIAESLLTQAEADDAVARLNVWRAIAGLAAARGDLSTLTAPVAPQP
jgi:outer membrane protein TolC